MPSRKRATPINPASAIKKCSAASAGGGSGVSQRPFRDRVLHLLALRPYRKAELLLRLQKDGLAQADKDALDGLLQQVRAARGGARGTGHCLLSRARLLTAVGSQAVGIAWGTRDFSCTRFLELNEAWGMRKPELARTQVSYQVGLLVAFQLWL